MVFGGTKLSLENSGSAKNGSLKINENGHQKKTNGEQERDVSGCFLWSRRDK